MKRVKKEVFDILKRLNDYGYEAYIVGGAIRNYLLNTQILDYDITTNASSNTIKQLFNEYKLYDIGKKHGTVSIIIKDLVVEITPYRHESDYKDHRHPSKISFDATLKQDIQRRDFTINSLCMDKDGNIIDLFNGIDDINNRIIKAIGNPKTRFNEDALRILRALRFKVKMDFEIEEKTDIQIHKLKDLLNYISEERKKDELLQILSCKGAFKLINEYLDVFNTFMPFRKINRKINNFTNPLYSLSYLLKDEKSINLKALKYSNQEIDLIRHLISATKIKVNDDYQFIKILSTTHQKDTLSFLNQYHRKNFNKRYEKLRKYMIELNDLAIDGKKIEQLGYKGKDIGKIKTVLLEMIHHKRISNKADILVKYLKENIL